MSKAVKMLTGPWGLGLMFVLACWMTAMFGTGVLLMPTLGFGVFVAMWRQSWILFAAVVALNPLSVHFAGGITDYWRGAPSIRFMGYPRFESFNVDPVNRCFYSTGGCCISGGEWVYLDPHNAAVRLMLRFFGPPSKSYDGPYPTKEEASHLVAEASTTPVPEFLKGKIHVGEEIFELPPELITQMLERLGLFGWMDSPDNPYDPHDAKIQAVAYQDRCLIVRLYVASITSDGHRDIETDLLAFFDKKTRRPFAFLHSSENDRTHFPPVTYLPERR